MVANVTILKINKSLRSVISILIAVLAIAYIVYKILQFDNLPEAFQLFRSNLRSASLWLLVPVLIGFPISWYFEILKWKLLIQKVTPLSMKTATLAVLTGTAMASLTPNGIGEVFSRVLILPPDKRPQAIAYSGINIISRLIVVHLFGIAGFLFLITGPGLHGTNLAQLNTWIYLLGIALTILLILSLVNTRWISWLLRISKMDSRFPGINPALKSLTWQEKAINLALSAARYLTFSLQFFFLLKYFGHDWDFLSLMAGIMTIYLILNFIPVIAVGEPGVRGSVTLLIIGQQNPGDLGALSAALLLWMLNVAIPILAGSYWMRKIKI